MASQKAQQRAAERALEDARRPQVIAELRQEIADLEPLLPPNYWRLDLVKRLVDEYAAGAHWVGIMLARLELRDLAAEYS